MITYSAYERDNRVMRYAEALAARGDSVEVISLKKGPHDPAAEKLGSTSKLYRIRGRYRKGPKEPRRISSAAISGLARSPPHGWPGGI